MRWLHVCKHLEATFRSVIYATNWFLKIDIYINIHIGLCACLCVCVWVRISSSEMASYAVLVTECLADKQAIFAWLFTYFLFSPSIQPFSRAYPELSHKRISFNRKPRLASPRPLHPTLLWLIGQLETTTAVCPGSSPGCPGVRAWNTSVGFFSH